MLRGWRILISTTNASPAKDRATALRRFIRAWRSRRPQSTVFIA